MRPYRWQDPPPPPAREIRWRREQFMRFNAEPETIALPVRDMSQPKVLSMAIDGAEYVEAPEPVDANACSGCAFAGMRDCDKPRRIASHCFGNFCDERHVIYIRKA